MIRNRPIAEIIDVPPGSVFLWILVLQSFCLLCKGCLFLHLFVFLSVDVRSWQVPPKSQEATRLRSQGLLGSTGKTEPSQSCSLYLVLSVLPLFKFLFLEAGPALLSIVFMCTSVSTLQILFFGKLQHTGGRME